MVSSCPLISNSSSLFTKTFGIVTISLITVGITVTFMFHSFFSSHARSKGLYFFFACFYCHSGLCRYGKIHYSTDSAFSSLYIYIYIYIYFFFFFGWLSLGLVVWIVLGDPFVTQNPGKFCASYSSRRILVCASTTCSYELFYIFSSFPPSISRWFLAGVRHSKSPHVSRTLLSILADLDNAVVLLVSTCFLISKTSSLCTNLLVTVLRAPIALGITITFMFFIFFFNFLAR